MVLSQRLVLLLALLFASLSFINASVLPASTNGEILERGVEGKLKGLGAHCTKSTQCASKKCSSKSHKCIKGAKPLLANGKKCTLDSSCSSKNCQKQKCAAKKGINAPCTKASNCQSGYCSSKNKCAVNKHPSYTSTSSKAPAYTPPSSPAATPAKSPSGSTPTPAASSPASSPTRTAAKYVAASTTSMSVPAASQTFSPQALAQAASGGLSSGNTPQTYNYAGNVKLAQAVPGGPQPMSGSTSFFQTTASPGNPALIQLASAPAKNMRRKRDIVQGGYYNAGFYFNPYSFKGSNDVANDFCTVAIVIDGLAVQWQQIDGTYTSINKYRALKYHISNYYGDDEPEFGAIVACYGNAVGEVLFDGIIWEEVVPDVVIPGDPEYTDPNANGGSDIDVPVDGNTGTGGDDNNDDNDDDDDDDDGVDNDVPTTTTTTSPTTSTNTPAPSGMAPAHSGMAPAPSGMSRRESGIYKRFNIVMRSVPNAVTLKRRDDY